MKNIAGIICATMGLVEQFSGHATAFAILLVAAWYFVTQD